MDYINVYNDGYINACKNRYARYKIKVELLDWYEFAIAEITNDVSADSGKINITNAQGTRRSCSLTLCNFDNKYNPNENSAFWIDRKFKLYLGIQSGSDTYWFSKGVYVTTNISTDLTGCIIEIDAADKFTILSANENAQRFCGSVKIEMGEPFDEAIRGLLGLDIGNNRPIDPISPVIDTTLNTSTLPYDIIKDSDTSVGDMLTEFAEVMDADIFYDDDGHLVVQKSVVDDCVNRYEQFASQWDFTKYNSFMSKPNLDISHENIINTVIVTNDSSDSDLESFYAVNDNPQSPIRVSLIGTKAGEIVKTEMGYDEQRRKEYANRLLQEHCLCTYTVTFESMALPHMDVNRPVTITYEEYEYDHSIFVVQDCEFDFNTGLMSISATELKWLPSYC